MSAPQPAGWSVVAIREFASIGTGARDTQDRNPNGRYPFFVRSQQVERIGSWSFDGEAVLTAGDGVGTGKVIHYIDGRFDYHQRVYRISNFRSDVSGRYFYYQFRRNFLARIESLTAKSSVDSVRMETIAGMPILLPERAEQDHIVAVLDDAEDLVESLRLLIEKKKACARATLQSLLHGDTRLPKYNDPWRKVRLADLLVVRHGKSQKSIESDQGRYPILATGGEIGRTDVALHNGPSVLIGRKGTIDRPQYQAGPFWTVDTLFHTDIGPRADARFLYYLFTTIDWRSMNEASGVPSLNARQIESVVVTVPEAEEQCAIREILDDADREVRALLRKLDKAQALATGLAQSLLTGGVRLEAGELVA